MGGVLLAACQPASDNKPEQNSTASATVSATVASVQSPHHVASVAVASTVFPQTAENGMPKQINWAWVDSGVKPVDKASFKYPFELDSEPVNLRPSLLGGHDAPFARALGLQLDGRVDLRGHLR